jgi:hypothetical protein
LKSGDRSPQLTGIGQQILHALAQEKSEPSNEDEPEPNTD